MKHIDTPEQNSEHITQLVIKGALGAIPIVGGATGEVFDIIYKSGYEKRLNEWRESVSNTINKLSEVISIENLKNNEEFQSLLTESTLVALKTHQKIKLEAILNLLYNSTISKTDYDFSKLFLNYIDQFTNYHFKVLNVIINNQEVTKDENKLNHGLLEEKILADVFNGDRELKKQIINDLEVSKGIIVIRFSVKVSTNKKLDMLVLSKLGEKFVKFIKDYD